MLTNLGIENSPSGGHQNHFHIYLTPPTIKEITKAPKLLQSETEALSVSDMANETTNQESELTMAIVMDFINLTTLMSPPAIVRQADMQLAGLGPIKMTNEAGYKKVFSFCQDAEGAVEISVFADVLDYLGYRYDSNGGKFTPTLDIDKDVKTSVLVEPKHGTMSNVNPRTKEKDPNYWLYDVKDRAPDGRSAYTGTDRVVFLVEVKGQKFKVVVNLLVAPSIDDRSGPECTRIQFSSTSNTSTLASLNVYSTESITPISDEAVATLQNTNLDVAQLEGGALAQTNGSGVNASITLDDNAAGYGWYVDSTPSLNEDFLPTSNPNEWIARIKGVSID